MGYTPKPLAEGRISASEATEIIRRASEIDAAGEYLSLEELRRVAAEAGIDARATDAAIAEVVGGRSTASPQRPVEHLLMCGECRSKLLRAAYIGGAIGVFVSLLLRVVTEFF